MTAHSDDVATTHELAPGILVSNVVHATTAGQVADVLQDATQQGMTVIPFGGRRSLATGNPVGPARIGLDVTHLRGLLAYEPADLTISVCAGTTLAEIQAELHACGQELPIDVPDPETATIGGLVATGFAGPRRLRSGSLRDLLIGCEYIRGDGLLARAGGMVVKNVSGFEIPRFLHGSWGALAVLTSVNLKVTPRPKAEGTVIAACADLASAAAAGLDLIAFEPSIEACVVIRDGGGIRIAARAVGRAAAVSETLAALANSLGQVTDTLDDDSSRTFWQDHTDAFAEAPDAVLMAMSTRPRDVTSLAMAVDAVVVRYPVARIAVAPGLGTLRVIIPAGDVDVPAALTSLADVAGELGAGYVLEAAPPKWRSVIPAWGLPPDGIGPMLAVKREFDPVAILNPGRLFI